jgi:hypothetical protein
MALAIVQRPLSAASDGLPIQLSATAGAGTTLHTMVTGTTTMDRVFMFAANSSSLAINVTIEWGASTTRLSEVVPGKVTSYPIISGLPLWGRSGSVSATVLKGYASTSAVINIFGYVNRVTES